MRIERAIVILRHNTKLLCDARLAIREFEILVGERGQPLATRRELVSALGGTRIAYVVKLSKTAGTVAMLWREAPLAGLIRLLQRSAFAQEIFVQDSSEEHLKAFRQSSAGVTLDALDLTGSSIVALSWNYII